MMKKGRSPLGAKRRLEPLMIEDAQESETLPPKMSRKNVDADYHVPSVMVVMLINKCQYMCQFLNCRVFLKI